MPTVSEIARVTVKDGNVWRTCTGCGLIAALPPEVDRCDTCTTPPPSTVDSQPSTVDSRLTGGMATVRLITALLREIPPYDAPALVRAEWFQRKAEAFDAIATQDRHLAAEAAQLAEGARIQAEELRRGWSA